MSIYSNFLLQDTVKISSLKYVETCKELSSEHRRVVLEDKCIWVLTVFPKLLPKRLLNTHHTFSRCTLHSSLKSLAKEKCITQQRSYQQQLIYRYNLKEVSIMNISIVWSLLLQCFRHYHNSKPDLGSTMDSGHRWAKFNHRRFLASFTLPAIFES